MRECRLCHNEIPHIRLEALPDTELCVKCSEKFGPKPVRGFMISSHSKGTAPVLVTVDPDDTESMRRAVRADRRMR